MTTKLRPRPWGDNLDVFLREAVAAGKSPRTIAGELCRHVDDVRGRMIALRLFEQEA